MPADDVGVLDTCVYLDLGGLDAAVLPRRSVLTAVTIAELGHGVAAARTAAERARRSGQAADALRWFDPLPFDSAAAVRFGHLAELVVGLGRALRPRRQDLMIAATAAAAGLPLFTRNPDDFRGLGSVLRVVGV